MTFPAGCVDGQLAGRYRLDERIAVGGMGEVWRGEDIVLGRPVAVKCLKPEYVHDAEFRERFRGEARHAAALSHPGIASVYDYGEQADPEAAWLVMELVEGEPLSALLAREGRLSADRTLDIVGQAALGLEAAHEIGVVHRDVKPGNLLVRPDGVVKITDFGIARAADAVPITRTGSLVGTAYYLSPEQASGEPVTPASDVYALGVVAYECLAGRRPFPGSNPMAVATAHVREQPPPLPGDVPEPVRELVARAMEKDPSLRPAHAGDLGRAAFSLRAQPDTATPQTRVLPLVPESSVPPRPGRRRPASTGLAVPKLHEHRRAVRIASVLLAVVLVGLSARACFAPAAVVVPTIAAGSTAEAAADKLDAVHLDAVQTTETSTTIATGRVIRTLPAGGTKAHEGDDVTLVVSSGKPKVTLTSSAYAGKSPTAVRTALLGRGFAPTLTYDGHGTPAGTVSSVSPTGSLTYGAAITVHVVPVPRAPAPRRHGKGKKGD